MSQEIYKFTIKGEQKNYGSKLQSKFRVELETD